MKTKALKSDREYLYRILIIAAAAVAAFPVSCNYIMSGGIITEWTARVQELGTGLGEGHLYLFPQSGTLINTGISTNSMNSNLWFLLPGLLYRLSGSMVLAYRAYMLMIQGGTLLASLLLFRRIFPGEEGRLPAFFGILLYMTCPYRIYVCYDLANLSQAAAWMLLPLYVWAAVGVLEGKERMRNLIFAALSLAGLGYADTIFFVAAAGITLLLSLILRKAQLLISIAAGGALFGPGLYRLAGYLFSERFAGLDMPLKSIMQNGYRLGYYFSSYSFRDGHPGMGLGMLFCLLTGGWLRFVMKQKDQKEKQVQDRVFFWLAVLFVMLSFYYFPWDFVQRLGLWALKLVSLAGTPALFWGMAFLCLCVPAARFVDDVRKCGEKWAALAVPAAVMLSCIGICVYQCNTLTYNRLPLDIL